MRRLEDIEFLNPRSLAEALAWMADASTRGAPLAGGTDLMTQWTAGVRPLPARAINLRALAELKALREEAGRLVIGGGVTHAVLRRSPLVARHLPSLAAAAATVGGAQIQAMGTIGGSLANASPAGDLAPSLLAADAEVVLASVAGERRVAAGAFFLGYRKLDLRPEELIVRIEAPAPPPGAREGFRKLGPRASQAISKVVGAWRARAEGGALSSVALAFGSVAPVPVRLRETERWLIGRPLDAAALDEVERRAADEVAPIDDIRSTAAYRSWVTGRLVRSFVGEALAAASPPSS